MLCILVVPLTFGVLEFLGVIWHTDIFARGYEIKGLDVSNHQHIIEWYNVSSEDYKFVFMKATEGEDFVDKSFEINWKGAKDNKFLVGAYHFFVTSSTGEEQANNFIRTVPVESDSLPPVIDLEVNKRENKEMVVKNLEVMIDRLEEIYGKKPIIYVTYDTYNAFVKGSFQECDIWIRDIMKLPRLEDEQKWVFWQYCNRGRIEGIDTYVDINVFHGTEKELIELTK
ncbi:MAG: glycoside hydrolase [Firmicutes bacterium HGW-Firmicutes-7]|nr:MAG: glycoside hydrolase [Firmicutes bacterium HGW-Firmicutes-7]